MDSGVSTNGDYRYPGTRPFYDTDIDRCLFFGRDRETQVLLHKILADKLVVLYAKSGLGKTSLINAGLNQVLRDRGFIPLMIRFNNIEIELLQNVYAVIKEIAEKKSLDYEEGERDSLWQYFKTTAFWSTNDTLLKPVLIMDQFEEFFMLHSYESRKHFIQHLADVVNNNIPQKLRESVSRGKPFPYSEKPPNVKIIISIREDYLGQLDEMSNEIPDILHNRFRLLPLNREQARQAIVKPSRVKDEVIGAASFEFAAETVDMMLNFLCKRMEMGEIKITDEVESFQLQLLCRHVEEKVQEKLKKIETDIVVKPNDLGGEKGIRRILQQFYDDQVKTLVGLLKKRRARKLCEKGLISPDNRRLSLEESEIKRKFGVTKELLRELVNARLLRSEPRVGSIYYELSHDTLVAPIRESQKKHRTKKRNIKLCVFLIFILVATVFFIKNLERINLKIKTNELYEEAGDLKTNREYEGAAEKYNAILEIDKKFVKAYLEMGQIYYEKRDYGEAISIYNKAIDNKIKHARIYYQLGQTYWALGKMKEAVKNYEESLKIDPNLFKAFENLGEIYESRKEFERAIKSYQQSLKIDKERPEIYRKLAVSYIKNDELEKAIDAYKQALNMNVEYAEIYEEISDSLKEKGKWKCIEKIYELASESGSKKASLYFNLGNDYYELEMHGHAISNYKKAIEIDPKNAFAYLFWGAALNEQGRYSEAIEVINKVIEIDPKNSFAYLFFGTALGGQKKYFEAIDAYKKAIEVNPKYAVAYVKMGDSLSYLKKYPKAIEAYREATKIDPKFEIAYINMGNALSNLGKYNEAIEAYKKAIEINPKYADAYVNIGDNLSKLKKYSEAIKTYREATKVDPKSENAYLNMGNTQSSLGNYNEAIEAYKKAIEINPKYAIAYYNMGNALSNLKKYPRAIEAYRKASKLNPEFEKEYLKIVKSLQDDQEKKEKKPSDEVGGTKPIASSEIKETLQIPPKSEEVESIKNQFEIETDEMPPNSSRIKLNRMPINIDYKFIMKFQTPGELKDNAYLYYRRGIELLKKQKYNKAIKSFQRAIYFSRYNTDLYYSIGNAFYMHKIYDEAIELFEAVIRLDPKYYYAYNGLGIVLFAKKDYNSAIEKFDKAINLKPKKPIAYFNKGILFYHQKRYEEAIEQFREAIDRNSKFGKAYSNMGNAFYQKKEYDKALAAYRKAIEIDPKGAYAYSNIGYLLFSQRRYNQAIKAFEKSIELDPTNIIAKANLVEAYLIVKHFEKSFSLARQLLKEKDILGDNALALRFVSILSLISQGHLQEASIQLKTLIEYYESLPIDYARYWDYIGLREFISKNKKLSSEKIQLLLQLIDILESPKSEGDKKIKELEKSIPGIFK